MSKSTSTNTENGYGPAVVDPAEAVARRRRENAEFEARAKEAAQLATAIPGMQEDVDRIERKQRAFREIGDKRLEMPIRTFEAKYQTEIIWQPILSLHTGNELAEQLEPSLEALRAGISERQATIEGLLARPDAS